MAETANIDAVQSSSIRALEVSIEGLGKDISRLEAQVQDNAQHVRDIAPPDMAKYMGMIGSVVGFVVLAGASLTGYVITQQSTAAREALSLKIAAVERIAVNVEEDMESHRVSDGHPALAEKHSGLRKQFDKNEDRFKTIIADISKLNGLNERARLLISKVEDRVRLVEVKSTHNERGVSSVSGTAESSFVELESQLRGIVSSFSSHISWQGTVITALAGKLDMDLQVNEISLDSIMGIPASAETSPGRVKQNGN